MTDLAKPLRAALAAEAAIRAPQVLRDTTASDGTRKWLLDAGSGNAVEAVYIPEDDRGTLCISSQAGCALDCAFCSTGKQGFNRNLTTGEIVGQLWHANRTLLADGMSAAGPSQSANSAPLGGSAAAKRQAWGEAIRAEGPSQSANSAPSGGSAAAKRQAWGDHTRAPITNVVMMGMGEPLANFDNVVPALRLFLDDNAYGLSRRRVTLVDVGPRALDRPAARRVPGRARRFAARAHRRVARPAGPDQPQAPAREPDGRLPALSRPRPARFHHVRVRDARRRQRPAERTRRRCLRCVRDVPCKVNLIPFNPFPGTEFATSPRDADPRIRKYLAECRHCCDDSQDARRRHRRRVRPARRAGARSHEAALDHAHSARRRALKRTRSGLLPCTDACSAH